MSLGLTNAPRTFMRLMNHLLRKFLVSFLWYILIYFQNLDDLCLYLRVVSQVLRQENFHVNLKSVSFASTILFS